MKNLIVLMGCITLSFSSLAGGPKTAVKDAIKTELQKANFIQESGETGELLVQFRINQLGRIEIENSNSDNELLLNRFTEFVENMQFQLDDQDQVFKMRFVFRRY
jgi:hypothetical protein